MTKYMTRAAMVALSFGLAFLLGACDGDNPVAPRTPDVTVSFDCLALSAASIECTGLLTGGVSPFAFFWEATSQTPVSGLGVSTVVFDYSRFCNTATEPMVVSVRLAIREDSGRGTQHGPVTKGYEVCTATSAAAQAVGTGEPIEPEFWDPQGLTFWEQ